MAYKRTQIFKHSLAHESRISPFSYQRKLWEKAKTIDTDEKVPAAFAEFWAFVAKEMSTPIAYFRID